jgi:inosine-uridine nucleoside N-ribohydrolase
VKTVHLLAVLSLTNAGLFWLLRRDAMKRKNLDEVAAVAMAILLLAGCAPRKAPATSANQTPVIIDTDMSPDDIMAILYVLNRPELSVQAITVVGTGEAHCGPGVEHALGVVAIAGAGEIPVACGRETPLAGDHAFPAEWREMLDGAMGIDWPAARRNPAGSRSAVQLLKEVLDAATQPVVLLTDGPLTNVAELFQAYPELVKKVKMVYSMGGAIDVPGNTAFLPLEVPNKTAEFNIYVDPRAASLVLQSGAPLTLVPLDVTNQVPLDLTFYKLLEARRTTPSAQAVYELLTELKMYGGKEYLWDPLAYAIASDESLARYETRKLIILEEEGPESGRTKASEDGSPARVALSTDADRFIETYLSTINGGQAIALTGRPNAPGRSRE